MLKIITWLDLEGRYRVTSIAYNDPTRPPGETEDEAIDRVVAKLKSHYALADTHLFHFVEEMDQRARLFELEGTYFRYPGKPDALGKQDARQGAWIMDVDGRPMVDMAKARGVHMDYIRIARDVMLTNLDLQWLKAIETHNVPEQLNIEAHKQTLREIPQTYDLSAFTTPSTLKAAWPAELPRPQ